MKTSPSSATSPALQPIGLMQGSGLSLATGKARQQASAIVIKTATDPKQQHAAIGKLIKMCKASAVVSTARQGITAEVRRDRDHDHA